MTIFTSPFQKSVLRATIITSVTIFFLSLIANAQSRPYSLVYSENLTGGTALFGNTLLHVIDNGTVNLTKMNSNSFNGSSKYGNNNENMQYIDIDRNSGNGSVTRNSSTADLQLPSGTNTIKLARLYWGGFIVNSEFDLNVPANRKIKIRKDTTSAYLDVTALGIDTAAMSSTSTQYQAYADVTSFVKSKGAGTYEIGNVPASVGVFDGGSNCAWYLVVVYENPTQNFNSVRVYDGFEQIYNGGNAQLNTVNLTGLNVPSGSLAAGDATMGVVAWEGDAQLTGDFLNINGNVFSNATNQPTNPWNGTITKNGVHVTAKNPNYTNQMGVDIDQFNVGAGYGIAPNASSVTLQFGTKSDRYFPGLITFQIKMKDPVITLKKTVADANNNNLGEKNEVLTYTLKGTNTGVGNANAIVISDTLPATVTYVPNSLQVISCPGVTAGNKTDISGDDNADYIVNGAIKTVRFRIGTGSNGSKGGTLASGETYQVQFKVTVNDPGAAHAVPSIINIARIKAISDANVNFVDDGTAIINPENGPLPVTLVSFTALLNRESNIKIDWATSMEINCSKYQLERGSDGKSFSQVATVAGNGTTNVKHAYLYNDDITAFTANVAYYRLKQVDLDGKSTYSKTIAVKLKSNGNAMNISPNPFNSYLNVNMDWSRNELITVNILNVQGKNVVSKNVQLTKGANYFSVDQLSKLSPGNYYIVFISGSETITKKIAKQ